MMTIRGLVFAGSVALVLTVCDMVQAASIFNNPANELADPAIIASQTPFSAAYVASNVFDGIFGTGNGEYATSNAVRGDAFIDFDFGTPKAVGGLVFYQRTGGADGVTSFQLIFDDSSDFSSPLATRTFATSGVRDFTLLNDQGNRQEFEFPVGVSARYVRWDVVSAIGNGYDGAAEMGFWTGVAVPEPTSCITALAGLACGGYSMRRRRKLVRRMAAMLSIVAAASIAVGGSTVHAATVTWFGPSQAANSNATWTGTTSAQNYGVAFVSGTASAYSMDWLQLGLNTSSMTTGSGSLVVELRNTTNLTPYSAVSGTTVYAADTITFTCPTTQATSFTVNLAPANFPNISSFSMTGTTGYSLRLWGPSGTFGILRTTGYANGTTNNFYTVSDGFVALDTFRNNIANYTNTTNSYPTLSIAFGTTAVPEPSTCAMALVGIACGGWQAVWRRRAR